ncbi:MAG TPA: undecaprenyl-diphosphate phosphatase [Mycobacteriales bacterium]|nr:undecaprenyl-diphosphate phosphatase [Mycobacteriales bacterium]
MRPAREALLGAVQGAAEVFPVSSSAQLSLLPWLARWELPADRTRFAAGLHAGSTLGLAIALRHDLARLNLSEVRRLLLSSAPAAVVGLLAHDAVDGRLGRPGPTAALLAGAGLVLWASDARADRGPSALTPGDVAAASLAQVIALAPGVSRSGATLTALRARGVPREDALRTSLLMSLPVAAGAAGLTAVRGGKAPPLVPAAVAGLTAWAAARRVAPTQRFVRGSVLYRLAVAAAVARRLRKEAP